MKCKGKNAAQVTQRLCTGCLCKREGWEVSAPQRTKLFLLGAHHSPAVWVLPLGPSTNTPRALWSCPHDVAGAHWASPLCTHRSHLPSDQLQVKERGTFHPGGTALQLWQPPWRLLSLLNPQCRSVSLSRRICCKTGRKWPSWKHCLRTGNSNKQHCCERALTQSSVWREKHSGGAGCWRGVFPQHATEMLKPSALQTAKPKQTGWAVGSCTEAAILLAQCCRPSPSIQWPQDFPAAANCPWGVI